MSSGVLLRGYKKRIDDLWITFIGRRFFLLKDPTTLGLFSGFLSGH